MFTERGDERPEVGVREVVVTVTAQFTSDGYFSLAHELSEPVSRVWLVGLIELLKDSVIKSHT